MNISYRIDEDFIDVTDEKDKNRRIPKYEHAEEILKLQNDIEAIEILLASKENEINESVEERANYKTYALATVGSVILTIGSFLLVMSGALSLIGLGASLLFLVAAMLAAKKFDDVRKLMTKNDRLIKEIGYLKELKKSKSVQLEKLKKNISKDQQERAETPVPIIERNNEVTIEECIQLLRDIEGESNITDLTIAYGVMQEIQNEQEQKAKQKVLK